MIRKRDGGNASAASVRKSRSRSALAASLGVGITAFAGIAGGLTVTGLPHLAQLGLAAFGAMLSGGITYQETREKPDNRQVEASNGKHVRPSDSLSQLPLDIQDFTGRAEQAAAMAELLGAAGRGTATIVIAVSGQGGVGKTSLALHVAHRVRDHFPDGQLYVNLRGAEARQPTAGDVLDRFLRELGVDPQAVPEDIESRARMYRAQLADRRVLVVLDNAHDEGQVRPLLPGTANCAVIATCRAPLGALPGVRMFPLDVMPSDDAYGLLVAVLGEDRVSSEPDAAKEIAALCGYLPLALRIAAALLAGRPHESLSEFAQRLRDEHAQLDQLKVGDLEVRTSFALSYEDCDPDLKQAFRALGMLRSSDFPAWKLAALLDTGVRPAERLMEQLVDAQLIQVVGRDRAGIRRYRFHDLMRTFARERLEEEDSPERRQRALFRFLDAMLAAAKHAAALVEPGTATPTDLVVDPSVLACIKRDPRGWFGTESNALVSAAEAAFDEGQWQRTWQLTSMLAVLTTWPTDWEQYQKIMLAGVTAAERDGNQAAAANARRDLGAVLRTRGDYDAAFSELRQSVSIFQALNDQLGEARALSQLGDNCRYSGHLDEGVDSFQRALTVFRNSGSPRDIAWALNGLGDLLRGQSRWEESVESFTECIQIYDGLQDSEAAARCRVRFGQVYRDQCLYAQAEELYQNGLAMIRSFADRRWEARTLRQLGVLWRNMGRTSDALTALTQVRDIFEDLADHRGVAVTQRNIGDAHRRAGSHDAAVEHLEDALRAFMELGDRRWEARSRMSLADTVRHRGRWDDAGQHLQIAETILKELGDRPGQARVLRSYGLFHRGQRQWDNSADSFIRSREIFTELGDLTWAARTHASLGTTLREQGDKTWRQHRDDARRECIRLGAVDVAQASIWLHEW